MDVQSIKTGKRNSLSMADTEKAHGSRWQRSSSENRGGAGRKQTDCPSFRGEENQSLKLEELSTNSDMDINEGQ